MKVAARVLAALRATIEADSSNVPLRLHLAALLLDAGEAAEALTHCAHVLAHVPDDVEALELGARAAEASGETARAAAYRRMHAALAGAAPAAATAAAPPPPPASASGSAPGPTRTAPRTAGVPKATARGAEAEADDDDVDVEPPSVRLADVGGMERVKQRLHTTFLGPMANPDLLRTFGKSLRGGLLLYGPPGCGKTFIARAVAGEMGAHFIGVGLHEVLDMWLGASQKRLHAIFENARRSAPCVLFFDEVDALGRKRIDARHSGTRDVVVQLLAELDSFGSKNEGVFVLAATNHPWDVDSALRRPGRFDRTLLVLPPDEKAREAILRYHLRERPLADDVDCVGIAAKTKHYSGADLAHVCETATEYAFEDSVAIGEARAITNSDLLRAVREVTPSTTEWLNTARNYAQFANEAGTYDDLLAYLREEGMT